MLQAGSTMPRHDVRVMSPLDIHQCHRFPGLQKMMVLRKISHDPYLRTLTPNMCDLPNKVDGKVRLFFIKNSTT